MNTRQVIQLIEDDGWYLDRSKGSHRQYKHHAKPGTVTVAYHGANKDVTIGILKKIKKQAGLQ